MWDQFHCARTEASVSAIVQKSDRSDNNHPVDRIDFGTGREIRGAIELPC